MRKWISLLLCLLLMAGASAREVTLLAQTEALIGHLQQGQEEQALAMMDNTMLTAMKGKLAGLWPSLVTAYGAFVGIEGQDESQADGYWIIELELRFARQRLIQRTVYDADGRVAGLFFRPGQLSAEAQPEGVREEAVVVDAGLGFPLDGLYARPVDEVRAAVLLLAGSGPADRDGSVGANKPLRDIAQGLAEHGIASLRFDKRTLAYGAAIDPGSFTVDQEYTQDALAAMALLRTKPELQHKPVYLLGHSLAASLLAHIDQQGAQAAGYILLAGTPRFLLELSVDQNELLISEFDQNGDLEAATAGRQAVDALRQAIQQLASMSEKEAQAPGKAVAGLPAWYLKHLMDIDALKGYQRADKPMLVLWGASDRQVSQKDYALWQDGLDALSDVHFISYRGLNHLMGRYEGDPPAFRELVTKEYAQRTPVDAQVIEDIANWMLSPGCNN